MIINKRIKRELKNNIFRYGSLFLILVLGMSICVSISAATDSVVNTIKECNKKNHVENGEFSVFVPLSEFNKKNLSKKGVKLEENFYLDFNLNDNSTLRVFKNRKDINLIELSQGHLAEKNNEIVLEKLYAKKHNYKLNDTIKIADKNYTITGIGTAPDYNLVLANISDVASNTEKFSVSFVNEEAYYNLKATEKSKSSEEYCYSYILEGKMTHKELRTYLADLEFDKEKITNIYMKEIIDKIEKEKEKFINGTKELSDGSKKIANNSEELKDGAEKLETGSSKLQDGLSKLNNGMEEFFKSLEKLNLGTNNIKEGTAALKNGSKSLENGLANLTSHNKALMDGAESIFNSMLLQGSSQLSNISGNKVNLNKDNYEQTLNSLIKNTNDKSTQNLLMNIKQQLNNYGSFYNGLKSYLLGTKESYKGSINLSKGAETLYNGSEKLEDGTYKIYNASIDLKNGTSNLNKGSIVLKDGISSLAKGTSEFNKGSKKLHEGMEKLNKEVTNFANKNMNYKYENLTLFLTDKDNVRINGCEEDIKINKVVSIFAGIIFIILVAYIVSVFITHNIESESAIIGTLYSMGYLKKELLMHFLILPVTIVALGGIIGTSIGFLLIPTMAEQSVEYFSVPNIENLYSLYILGYGIVLPTLIAIGVNILVINKKLSREPLKLLRKERKQSKITNIDLGNMSFINRFRFRQLFRELKGNITLFTGLFLAILLMVFAFTIQGSIINLVDNTAKDVNFKYMYLLKFPPEKKPNNAHASYIKSLNAYYDLLKGDLEVAILGIDNDNPFFDFNVKCNKDEIYISNSVAKKFDYKKGDKITLKDNLQDESYTFTIAGEVNYSQGLYAFMDIKNMRKIFSKPKDYYNALLSKEKLNIDTGRVLSITSYDDILQGVSLFLKLMKPTMYLLLIISILIFMLVMYLLLKMMIDKSTFSISLIKVFGFNPSEINKLYLGSPFYTVLISVIISLPLSKIIMEKIYPYMVSNMATSIPAYIFPKSYIIMIIIIFTSYFIVNFFLKRHLKKISLVEILKNRE